MKGVVVWITGLPSSGKSLLAERMQRRLRHEGKPSCVLDGDAVRAALVPSPGHEPEARDAFYETLARLAALLAWQGLTVIVPATAHLRAYRDRARELAPRLLEVHLFAERSTSAERDAPYEAPEAPEIVALGGYDEEAIEKMVRAVG